MPHWLDLTIAKKGKKQLFIIPPLFYTQQHQVGGCLSFIKGFSGGAVVSTYWIHPQQLSNSQGLVSVFQGWVSSFTLDRMHCRPDAHIFQYLFQTAWHWSQNMAKTPCNMHNSEWHSRHGYIFPCSSCHCVTLSIALPKDYVHLLTPKSKTRVFHPICKVTPVSPSD